MASFSGRKVLRELWKLLENLKIANFSGRVYIIYRIEQNDDFTSLLTIVAIYRELRETKDGEKLILELK